jgi:hypothetical protein
LVRAAIDVARSCGAEAVTLDVIAENIPAGQLYRKLGFEIYNGSVEFLAPNNPLPLIDIPPGYDVRDLKSEQWQPHYELAKRVTPTNVQKFRPITVGRFQPSWIDQWLNRIVEPASGISSSGIAIYLREDRQPCATAQLTARTRQGGFHELDIRLDPAHPKVAVTILNAGISRLQNSHPNHSIHVHVYSWQEPLMLAAQEIGCSKLHTYHTMGMNVNSVGRLDLVGR